MADLSKVKIGGSVYTLKDAAGRDLISAADSKIDAEIERATGAEGGLDTRIKALESKGRYLSTWNAETGKPDTYPEASQLVEGKYNYRAGDYYIVNKVAASGNLMPDGAYITKDGETWTVPTKAFSGTLNLGDQFQYDGTNWTHIASATTVAFANIQGDAMDNTNLAGKLNAKEDKSNLKALAYKASASGTVAGQTISGVKATGSLSASITGDLGEADASASLTKAAYTPAGSITGSAISGGSINVTVKDAATATEAALTTSTFTPAGTVAAVTGGSFSALKTALFGEDSANGFQIAGSVSKPDVDLTSSEKTFATGLKGGSVAAFDTAKFHGGSLTGATAASFTQGSKASFTQGAKASFSKGTAIAAATEGLTAHLASGEEIKGDVDAETLIFQAAATDNVIGHDEATFTANGDDTFVANGDDSFTANNVGTFVAASMDEGIFTANTLQDVNTDKVNHITAAALHETPVFTGNKYAISTTADTALKEVAFTATNSADIVNKVEYLKQEIDAKTFTPVAAELGFSGTEVANFQVTGVSYKKATKGTLAATAALPEGGLSVGDITVQSKDVTVE